MQAANPAMGLLAQADDANCGCANWVNAMHAAVPDLGSMVAGWTVHPYGPRSRWEPRIDRLISQTAAVGWSSGIPIDITEWGIATDNGRSLTDNYDWPTNQTYQQAADAMTLTLNQMMAKPGFGSRLRLFTYFQAHDQQASGSSNERESLLRCHEERRLPQGRAHHDPGGHRRRAPGALTGFTLALV